jgi:hypothetical protein
VTHPDKTVQSLLHGDHQALCETLAELAPVGLPGAGEHRRSLKS